MASATLTRFDSSRLRAWRGESRRLAVSPAGVWGSCGEAASERSEWPAHNVSSRRFGKTVICGSKNIHIHLVSKKHIRGARAYVRIATFAFCVIIHEMIMCLRAAGRCFSTGARAGEARLLAAASGPPQRIVRRAEHLMVLAPRVSSNFESGICTFNFQFGQLSTEHGNWSVLNHASVSCRMRCDETNDFAYFGGVSGPTSTCERRSWDWRQRRWPVPTKNETGKKVSWRQTLAWSGGLTVTRRAPVQDQAKTKVCCCCCCC